MEKKVEEIVNKTNNETVNDLLSLFNSKKEASDSPKTNSWRYKLEFHNITQPSTISGSLFPNIVLDKEFTLFTFNGVNIFYDEQLIKMYTTVVNSKDMCIYRSGDRKFLITLDQFNKLYQSEIKDDVIQEDKVLISRNVLQITKYHEMVYFISFKKDMHTLNALHMDDRTLRPKILVPQLQVKYEIGVFPTQFGLFMKLDQRLVHEDAKKFNMKANGVFDFKSSIVLYKITENNLQLLLLNNKLEIEKEFALPLNGNVVKVETLGGVIIVRMCVELCFIELVNNEFVIAHKMTYEKYPAAIAFKLDDDIIKVYSLYCSESKITQKQKVELVGTALDLDLPKPTETSRLYDPISMPGNKIDDFERVVENLFQRLEEKITERENNERLRQNELLDKISEQLNNSLIKVVQKVIKYEIETVQKKLLTVIESTLNSNSGNNVVDETKVLQFTKEIICNTLLPVIEASMDEIRIQVLHEFKQMNNGEHLQEIKNHLSTLGLSNSKVSEISSLLLQNKYEECVSKVVEGGDSKLEEFVKLCNTSGLADVRGDLLLDLLEKMFYYSDNPSKGDEVIRTILSDIDPNTLTEDELNNFQSLLSQIKGSDIVQRPGNENIVVLCEYLTRQITRILKKRRCSISDNKK